MSQKSNLSIEYLKHVANSLVCTVLVLMPIVMVFDAGGLFAWDKWLACTVILFLFPLALFGSRQTKFFFSSNRNRLSEQLLRQWPLLVLFIATLQCCLQTVELPQSIVKILSPASHEIRTSWQPVISGEDALTTFPITIAVNQVQDVLFLLVLLMAVAFISGSVLGHRHCVLVLFVLLTVSGVIHGFIGIYQLKTTPGIAFLANVPFGKPFGCFINRNNAGAFLNIAISGAVGLLFARITYLTQGSYAFGAKERHRRGFSNEKSRTNSNDAFRSARWLKYAVAACSSQRGNATLVNRAQAMMRLFRKDQFSIISGVSIACISIAVTMSGSRGAFLGMICGALCCLVLTMPTRGFFAALLAGIGILFLIEYGAEEAGFSDSAIRRLTPESSFGSMQDGRIQHWPDGMRAAMAYMPAGAGVGGYRFAYLPFQNSSSEFWHLNADNQWLEWLVEAGALGMVLLLFSILCILVCLMRLYQSQDPVDRGLFAAGAYATASILTSQTFDFALTLPPIAMVVCLFACAISARQVPRQKRYLTANSAETTLLSREKKALSPMWYEKYDCEMTWYEKFWKKLGFKVWARRGPKSEFKFFFTDAVHRAKDRFSRSFSEIDRRIGVMLNGRHIVIVNPIVISCMLVTLLLCGVSHFASAANKEKLLLDVEYELVIGVIDKEKLVRLGERLDQCIADTPDESDLLLARARIAIQSFRFEEAEQRSRRLAIPLLQAYLELSPAALRADGYRRRDLERSEDSDYFENRLVSFPLAPEQLEKLTLAKNCILRCLKSSPLSDESRWLLLQLDFAVSDPEYSPEILRQLRVLRGRSPQVLVQVCDAAMVAKDSHNFRDAAKELLRLVPQQFSYVARCVESLEGQVTLASVLPDSRALLVMAIEYEMSRPEELRDRSLLKAGLRTLKFPTSQSERVLAKRIASILNED